MHLYTPANLHYPIKVTKIFGRPGDTIQRDQNLFNYEYTSQVLESGPDNPEGSLVDRTWAAKFESELEGTLNAITVTVGQILTKRTSVAEIEELCRHEIQYGGICANCGTDVTTLAGYNSTMNAKDRATVNTVHGHTQLLVSHSEASRADEEAKRRLLDTRKLILVCDLDLTCLHTCTDPTIEEWQQDSANPNHEAVKEVRSFDLAEQTSRYTTRYYVKRRKGLSEFLATMANLFELHIYTMGTRAYAENIAKIIDPDRRLFADRILSRDENGSINVKTLQRLFPVDTSMVVILDDRADIWNWSPNLIQVAPYDFFVGIGDINGSFLPKQPELNTPASKSSTLNGSNGVELSAVDQIMSMAGDQDADSIKQRTEEQDSMLAAQMADRPLLQKQMVLDTVDDEGVQSPAAETAAKMLYDETTDSTQPPRYSHSLLHDDDEELHYLTGVLQQIHRRFYNTYDGEDDDYNARTVPDVARIMGTVRSRVLEGVSLVFSGVIPLNADPSTYGVVILAKSFGAQVSDSITKRTTHVIASPERRTAKVRQARQFNRKGRTIKIVSESWLRACFTQWVKVAGDPFEIHVDRLGSEEDDLIERGSRSATPEAEGEEDDELAQLSPSNVTPDIAEDNWDDIDAEIADFLGSEAEDESDAESVKNGIDNSALGKRKRSGEESDGENGEAEGSQLQRRKKEALARTSSLIAVTAAPSSDVVNKEDNSSLAGSQADSDENDDLEAALAAELGDGS